MLPIGLVGRMWEQELVGALVPVRTAWLTLCQRFRAPAPKLAVSLDLGDLRLEDWVDKLRTDGVETAWLSQLSSKVLTKDGGLRAEKLAGPWLRQLACAAAGHPVTGYLVARDAIVEMRAPVDINAREALAALAALWRRNLDAPLPVAAKTALALLADGDPRRIYDGDFEMSGEVEDLCLARLWPDYASLRSEEAMFEVSEALYRPLLDWIAECVSVRPIAEGEE